MTQGVTRGRTGSHRGHGEVYGGEVTAGNGGRREVNLAAASAATLTKNGEAGEEEGVGRASR